MALRVTIIEDSRESQIQFLRSLKKEEEVQLQLISSPPYFDSKVQESMIDFKPDLVILDLLLLEETDSGFRVLRQLKDSKTLKNVPVVVCSKFITNDPKDQNRIKALGYGAVEALPKIPFPKAGAFLKHVPGKRNR
jgi:DNA-binding response OmpR family regulator